jgi:hypothetical protein
MGRGSREVKSLGDPSSHSQKRYKSPSYLYTRGLLDGLKSVENTRESWSCRTGHRQAS